MSKKPNHPQKILILSGSSEMARSIVVDKLLDDRKDLRHLALEDLREVGEWEEDITMEDVFGTMIACDCAKDELDKGHPIVITCPSLYLINTVRESMPTEVITVHMGQNSDLDHDVDHIIEATCSANQTCSFLHEILG